MQYIVLCTVERETNVIGAAVDKNTAQKIMRADFEKIFWQKVDSQTKDFSTAYDSNATDEYRLDEDSAYINSVSDYDYDWTIIETVTADVLEKPLTTAELANKCDDNCYVTGNILMDLSEFTNNDFETILDIMSERLTGRSVLMDINYTIIDTLPNNMLVVQVSGDVSNIIEENTDNE